MINVILRRPTPPPHLTGTIWMRVLRTTRLKITINHSARHPPTLRPICHLLPATWSEGTRPSIFSPSRGLLGQIIDHQSRRVIILNKTGIHHDDHYGRTQSLHCSHYNDSSPFYLMMEPSSLYVRYHLGAYSQSLTNCVIHGQLLASCNGIDRHWGPLWRMAPHYPVIFCMDF